MQLHFRRQCSFISGGNAASFQEAMQLHFRRQCSFISGGNAASFQEAMQLHFRRQCSFISGGNAASFQEAMQLHFRKQCSFISGGNAASVWEIHFAWKQLFKTSEHRETLALTSFINRGFPTRMVCLPYISCLRYTTLVRDPRN